MKNRSRRLLLNRHPASQELLEIPDLTHEVQGQSAYDALFAHVFSLEEMKEVLEQVFAQNLIVDEGILYWVYPKLKNQLGLPGIHRDRIFPYLSVNEETGQVADTPFYFNRMVALNADFTLVGAKRLDKGNLRKAVAPSGSVKDYEGFLTDLLKELSQEQQEKFLSLTPGRQRDWLRQIFSAKTQATKDKRQGLLLEHLAK